MLYVRDFNMTARFYCFEGILHMYVLNCFSHSGWFTINSDLFEFTCCVLIHLLRVNSFAVCK